MDVKYQAQSEHFVLKCDVLKAGKMDKCKDLRDSDKGSMVMLEIWVSTSPKLQLLWGVTNMQWSVFIKSGPRRNCAEPVTVIDANGGPCHPIQQTSYSCTHF